MKSIGQAELSLDDYYIVSFSFKDGGVSIYLDWRLQELESIEESAKKAENNS